MEKNLIRKNILSMMRLGCSLLERESIKDLQYLKKIALKKANLDLIQDLKIAEIRKTILPDDIDQLQDLNEFRNIQKNLKEIAVSNTEISFLRNNHDQLSLEYFLQNRFAPYILIGLNKEKFNDFGIYLTSLLPKKINEKWPGNPIGSAVKLFIPYNKLIEEEYFLEDIQDGFYHSMSGIKPIHDKNQKVIAFLGVDYIIDDNTQEVDNQSTFKKKIELNIRKCLPENKCSLSYIAHLMNMSESTLKRKMKNEYGKNFRDYVNDIKQEIAQEMLKSGAKVEEVSKYLGYKNPNSFINWFKEKFFITPKQWQMNLE